MYGHDTLFLYNSRRACQEQVAAINAACPAAAVAHRALSGLHVASALLAATDPPSTDLARAADRRGRRRLDVAA